MAKLKGYLILISSDILTKHGEATIRHEAIINIQTNTSFMNIFKGNMRFVQKGTFEPFQANI